MHARPISISFRHRLDLSVYYQDDHDDMLDCALHRAVYTPELHKAS